MDVLGNSILGLADIYNLLPKCVVEAGTVKDFQTLLQKLVKAAAASKTPGWKKILSPKCTLHTHAINKWFKWTPATGNVTNEDAGWCDDDNDCSDKITRLFAF